MPTFTAAAVGAADLLVLEAISDREPLEPGETALNFVFLILLEVMALSGIAVVAYRETAAMGPLLVFHISVVCGFFAALPACKLRGKLAAPD